MAPTKDVRPIEYEWVKNIYLEAKERKSAPKKYNESLKNILIMKAIIEANIVDFIGRQGGSGYPKKSLLSD